MPYSWFEFNLVKNVGRTKTFHSCQIPEQLSEMLFKATTRADDTVLVLFGGSGSELVVCQRLNLNFISAETNRDYCELIRQRLRSGGKVPERYRLMTYIRRRKRAEGVKPLVDA
jgi:DNA modification methylase